ncbi:FAD-dependent oxidoreductase [Paenibacillus sp. FSL R5-0912]|uniref:NAD(P)/FAD-dependent oxidoreductase n=1 Tax=Paenibacillus sp. FSL R5-0912 TaxID=1536771 RepID=UPI0004F6EA02|nr:FAD-dependent oxidoreductase [Paenibacillus sp. FSL R5-0912]AIQ41601.1 NAD(P)H-nitrite reductase [Paenibacillus sp. FSL R5-0912]
MTKHYVIVGGGVSAVHAAKAIRDQDSEAEISILGEESGLPYNRIKLTKGLFTDLHSEKVLIKKEKWYRDNRINVKTSTRITSIQPDRRMVETEDGQRVEYHKLLLCMGARNRALSIEGAGLHNVHTIRDMNDADRLKDSLQDGSRVAVIGGGVQGIETAWALFEAGYEVTVIEAAPSLMGRQLDGHSSSLLRETLKQSGVKVILQAGVTSITGTDYVTGITLDDGSNLPCDHVVYSIGIVPNTALVSGSAIQVRNGIIVNEQLQTSDPNIFAAGDVAEINGHVEGLWGGAIEQGRIAGSNMADSLTVYRRAVPVTLFNAFGISLFSIGNTDERQCDVAVSGEENGAYTRIYVKDNTITGALSWQGAAASLTYKSAVEQGISLTGIHLAGNNIEAIMAEVQTRLN